MTAKIIIMGAGAAGLEAAYRLQELGCKDWEIFERNSNIAGLAASFEDGKGFIWDIAGHVIVPYYDYVDKLVDRLLGGGLYMITFNRASLQVCAQCNCMKETTDAYAGSSYLIMQPERKETWVREKSY